MQVHVKSEWDRVIIVAGSVDIMMPYAAAFKVSQGVRLGSKRAMRMAGENSSWREFAELTDLSPTPTVNDQKRATMNGKFEWSVRIKDWDERVFMDFGNYELVLHFERALMLSRDIRLAAKSAKAWAGDGGRAIYAAGTLTDAENNYKRGGK